MGIIVIHDDRPSLPGCRLITGTETRSVFERRPTLTECSSEDSIALTLPLVGSLICTGAAVSLFSLPQDASLSWPQLLGSACLYVGAVACVHASVVWCVCRAFREHIRRPTWLLIVEIWGCSGWLPFIAFLEKERSLWVCAVVPLIVGTSVRFLKRRVEGQDKTKEGVLGESSPREIFYVEEDSPAWRALLPTAVIATATQAGIVALLTQQIWITGCLFAISTAILVWRYPLKPESLHPRRDRQRMLRSSAMHSLFIMALVGIALIPFLKRNSRAIGLEDLLGIQHTVSLRSSSAKHMRTSAAGYPGIVLMLPPKPHQQIVAPISADPLHWAGALAKPVVIAFDGAYWYFQIPDTRPRPDARIQRGDPLTMSIRSTNRVPIAMEAHQTLTTSIDMNCCKAMQLNLINADNQAGRIAVEVQLRDTVARPSSALSLGSLIIPSSKAHFISFRRPPTNESMTFRFPPGVHSAKFNEITVIVRPDSDRALAGSKVSIQDFVLVP
jgi:hypothetical protein